MIPFKELVLISFTDKTSCLNSEHQRYCHNEKSILLFVDAENNQLGIIYRQTHLIKQENIIPCSLPDVKILYIYIYFFSCLILLVNMRRREPIALMLDWFSMQLSKEHFGWVLSCIIVEELNNFPSNFIKHLMADVTEIYIRVAQFWRTTRDLQ